MARLAAQQTKRSPDRTRTLLIHAAFEEIWQVGFQAASLEAILERAEVTKGALYHHFPSKQALGYAVVDEYIRWLIYDDFLRPLTEGEKDPLDTLIAIIRAKERDARRPDAPHGREANTLGAHALRLGCPLNNLAQEMSPIDEGFRKKVEQVFQMWRDGLAKALRRGQATGHVSRNVDSDTVATFLVAAIEGAIGTAKNAQRAQLLSACLSSLVNYIESLRPQAR